MNSNRCVEVKLSHLVQIHVCRLPQTRLSIAECNRETEDRIEIIIIIIIIIILLFCSFFLFHLISFDMFNTDCKKSLKQTFNTAVDYNNVLTKEGLNNMIIKQIRTLVIKLILRGAKRSLFSSTEHLHMNTYLINIELLHQINICPCFLLMHLKAYIVCDQKIKLLFLLVKRYFWLAYGFDVSRW